MKRVLPAGAAGAKGGGRSLWHYLPQGFVRAVLKGHSSLGLAFAAAIYVICLTGSIVVFVHELQSWENPGQPRMTSASSEVIERAYDGVLGRAGKDLEHVYIGLPDDEDSFLTVTPDTDDPRDATWVADASGRLVAKREAPWTTFVTQLHFYLHLPRTWGLFIVGLTGVALLSSLISGLLAHPRIFRDAFHLRLGGNRRLQEADLHNRIGVWALPFHVLISLTGALLGLQTLIVGVIGLAVFQGDTSKVYALFLPPEPKEDARPAPPVTLAPMIAEALRRSPDGRIDRIFIEHPREMGATVEIGMADGSNRIARSDSFLFDRTGKLLHADRAADNNLGEAILGSIGRLHFGFFGGGLVKIAYGLLGLGLTYLAAGGVFIWLARRRDKGRPAPGWERVWTAMVWGQPLALAISAFVTIILPGGSAHLAFAIWAGATLACLGFAALLQAASLSRAGRLATGLILLALASYHSLSEPSDPVAWTTDAVLAAIAAILLISLHGRRTSPSTGPV